MGHLWIVQQTTREGTYTLSYRILVFCDIRNYDYLGYQMNECLSDKRRNPLLAPSQI
jgi:hypothetical protein